MFKDRREAGKKLASILQQYNGAHNTLVLGLPRGGVIVAAEVAKMLQLPLDITCPRKITAPDSPEYAIGAVSESGDVCLNQEAIHAYGISASYIQHAVAEETARAQMRLHKYRIDKPVRQIKDRCIMLVDDGLATGFTMLAAIKGVKQAGASKIIVAVPVGPIDTLEMIKKEVNECYCLFTPFSFFAVGEFYEHFQQTTDEEVMDALNF